MLTGLGEYISVAIAYSAPVPIGTLAPLIAEYLPVLLLELEPVYADSAVWIPVIALAKV